MDNDLKQPDSVSLEDALKLAIFFLKEEQKRSTNLEAKNKQLEGLFKEAVERVEFLHERHKISSGLRYDHIRDWLNKDLIKELMEGK